MDRVVVAHRPFGDLHRRGIDRIDMKRQMPSRVTLMNRIEMKRVVIVAGTICRNDGYRVLILVIDRDRLRVTRQILPCKRRTLAGLKRLIKVIVRIDMQVEHADTVALVACCVHRVYIVVVALPDVRNEGHLIA